MDMWRSESTKKARGYKGFREIEPPLLSRQYLPLPSRSQTPLLSRRLPLPSRLAATAIPVMRHCHPGRSLALVPAQIRSRGLDWPIARQRYQAQTPQLFAG